MSLLEKPNRAHVAGTAPVRRHVGLALVVIAAAQLMLVLDTTIMNVALPSIQRSLHMALPDLNFGAMGGLGAVVGLLLGGVLTQYLGWRWVLFVNVPIVIAVLAGTMVLSGVDRSHAHIDLPGTISVTAGLGALIYAINRATASGWRNGITITFLAVAAVLVAAFPLLERRSPDPMIAPRIVRNRGRVGSPCSTSSPST
jgi:MFS family permease